MERFLKWMCPSERLRHDEAERRALRLLPTKDNIRHCLAEEAPFFSIVPCRTIGPGRKWKEETHGLEKILAMHTKRMSINASYQAQEIEKNRRHYTKDARAIFLRASRPKVAKKCEETRQTLF